MEKEIRTSTLIFKTPRPEVFSCTECTDRPIFSPCSHIFVESMECYQYRLYHKILQLEPNRLQLFKYVTEWDFEHK